MKKIGLWLIGLYLLLYILPLGSRPLFEPDEVRYGEIAREIVVSGDWVVPRINGLRYFEKPIMGHWLNAIAQLIFGQNNFAVRISSAIASGFSALLLFMLVRRGSDEKNFALAVTGIFLSCGLIYFVGTFSVLDAIFSAWVTATLVFFYCAAVAVGSKARFLYLLLAGVACGCAFLTKGFLAFVIPAVTIVPWLIWEKRYRDIYILPWVPLIMVIIVIAPWSYLVHLRDDDFWHYFVLVEHFQRFTAKVKSQHPQPFWFFIPILLGGTLPWVFLLPGMVAGFRGKLKVLFEQSLMRYSACWLVFPFLLMSCSSGKLGPYILPCFPAVAILIGAGLREYLKVGGPGMFFRKTVYVLVGASAIMLIGLAVMQTFYFLDITNFALYDRGEIGKLIIVTVAILAFGLGMLSSLRRDIASVYRLVRFGLSVLPVFLAWHFIVPNLVIDDKVPARFIKEIADRIKPDTVIVSYKNHVTSLAWYLKRNDIYVYRRGGELTYGLEKPDAENRLLSEEGFVEFIKNKPKGQHVAMFVDSDKQFKVLPPFSRYFLHGENYLVEYD
ncbi:MAG: phospholipid carrier-dependent glycosyltransferase [Lentisphaerae bacterium]|nr:phospholipid carrier-dependent glycosyltransferase [Lentisphaerota bacterium]